MPHFHCSGHGFIPSWWTKISHMTHSVAKKRKKAESQAHPLEMQNLRSCCCCSVTQSCLALCDPMDWSMPGFPVLCYLLEFAQTQLHLVWCRGVNFLFQLQIISNKRPTSSWTANSSLTQFRLIQGFLSPPMEHKKPTKFWSLSCSRTSHILLESHLVRNPFSLFERNKHCFLWHLAFWQL